MQFVNGMIYGAGFTFAGVLTLAAMKAIFGLGVC
jgi:hypothetical protein